MLDFAEMRSLPVMLVVSITELRTAAVDRSSAAR